MRLRIDANGDIRVTLPHWTPYAAATAFAASKRTWIIENLPKKESMAPYMHIGKRDKLFIIRDHAAKKIRSSVAGDYIRITIPLDTDIHSADVQKAARTAAIKSLKKQAEQYLPGRLEELARKFGYNYKDVRIKQLKGRWGSCSSQKNITLNCFLMQLPDDLIDYVLLHELAHTRIMAHGKPFWMEMALYSPNLESARKSIKHYRPDVLNMQSNSN